ncbi:PKD domain-containing protein [bacterium]|nr:PKD domain-containing protein [bacterium]
MSKCRLSLTLSAVGLCLMLAACAAAPDSSRLSDAKDAAPQVNADSAGLPSLPSPDQLSARNTAMGPGPFLRSEGNDFLPLEAHSNLQESGSGSSGEFSPAYTPGGPLSGLAYGVYLLDTTGYTGPNFYVLDWDTAPADGSAFMAIANFDLNRWEWFAVPANNIVSPGAVAFDDRYRDANGSTFLALALTGSLPASLDYVRLGDNLPPIPALNASPDSGSTADSFTLDASASFDQDGEVANYSFFANNQTFDNGIDPVLENVSFSEAGDQFCVVTVTDDDGQQEQANVTIPVALGPLAVLGVSKSRMDVTETINFDASGSEAGEGAVITKYEFDPEGDGSFMDNGADATLENFSYSLAGYFNATLRITNDSNQTGTTVMPIRVDWRRTFNSAGYVGIYELLPAPDGGCFVCGTVENDALLMRLGPDGTVTWKRRLRSDSAAELDDFSGMAINGNGDLYVIGRQHYNPGLGVLRYLKLLQVDPADGGLAFEKFILLGGEQPNTGDLDLLVDSQNDLYYVGRVEDGTRTDICVFRMDSNGVLEQGVRWDDNGSNLSRSFGGATIDSSDNLYINTYSQVETNSAGRRLLLLSLTPGLSERWSRLLEITHNSETPDMLGEGICVSGGSVFVTATLESTDHYRGVLLKAGTDGSLTLSRAFSPQANVAELGLGHCFPDGFGGFWTSGMSQDPSSSNIDAALFHFSSGLDFQLSKHFGLNGNDDDAANCGPAIGSGGELFYGGYVVAHNSVFNDYVYNFETLDSVDWQTPGQAQDIDDFPASTIVQNTNWEDFSFADSDSGGGFVMRYNP